MQTCFLLFCICTALFRGLEFIIVVILIADVCLFVILFVLAVIYAAVNFPRCLFLCLDVVVVLSGICSLSLTSELWRRLSYFYFLTLYFPLKTCSWFSVTLLNFFDFLGCRPSGFLSTYNHATRLRDSYSDAPDRERNQLWQLRDKGGEVGPHGCSVRLGIQKTRLTEDLKKGSPQLHFRWNVWNIFDQKSCWPVRLFSSMKTLCHRNVKLPWERLLNYGS